MENIYERKLPKHKTFGMLPNCVHAFCEPCIVTWRRMDRYRPDGVKYVSPTSNLTMKGTDHEPSSVDLSGVVQCAESGQIFMFRVNP